MELTLGEIAERLGAAPPAESERRVKGYSIDSRTIRPGELFFAVRGQRLDGHDFVVAALEAGAAGAVVASPRVAAFPASTQPKLLAAQDPLAALQDIAAEVRRRWGGPVVAVTGSTGKTTTKLMIAALLGTRFRVLQNEGNLNNQFGLPLSLLRLQPETEVGVFELAMSGPGEIRLLARLADPGLGVVTNVGAAHLEFFPDVEAIARAKLELVEELDAQDWAVLNADDPRVAAFRKRMAGGVLTFGISRPAHFRAEGLEQNSRGGTAFLVRAAGFRAMPRGAAWKGKIPAMPLAAAEPAETRFHLPLLGRHNVRNLLAALATCYAFGLPPSSLQEAVAQLRPAPMRGRMVRLASGAWVVDDCYNSNPEALETMLAAVASLPARRKFAVLGGMMELGANADALHHRCGVRVAELGYDGLLTVGETARPFTAGARDAGMPSEALAHFASAEEAGARLREWLGEGDVALLKASRAVHLETVWDGLGERPGEG